MDMLSRLQNWSTGLILSICHSCLPLGRDNTGQGVPTLRKCTPGVGTPIANTDTWVCHSEWATASVRHLSSAHRLF